MRDTTTTHRVVCPDHTQPVATLLAARSHVTAVESAGHCRQPHTIEVRDGNTWLPLHIAQAREILAAKNGSRIDTADGQLVKVQGSWSKQASERADATANPDTDLHAWIAALGPHEDVTLTADGRSVHTGWCQCTAQAPADAWVRYERWTAQGRTAHGYVCPGCRQLVQAG